MAVQKVGSQIESISWMTADGFASAVNAFTAQILEREKGENSPRILYCGWDHHSVGNLYKFSFNLYSAGVFPNFITEADILPMGVDYLRIIGFSQLFMCMEITSSGAFQGLGRPVFPAATGIVLTVARIPMAVALSATVLGLNGIWWSISISSILKGILITVGFVLLLRRYMNHTEKFYSKDR